MSGDDTHRPSVRPSVRPSAPCHAKHRKADIIPLFLREDKGKRGNPPEAS